MASRQGLVLTPGEGRSYSMGGMSAVFKSDGDETEGKYTISEWWLEPHTQGPGAHSHPGDFEKSMPGIVDWFKDNPPGKA